MRIDYIVCPDSIADKIASQHHRPGREVHKFLHSTPRTRHNQSPRHEHEGRESIGAKIKSVAFHSPIGWRKGGSSGTAMTSPTLTIVKPRMSNFRLPAQCP